MNSRFTFGICFNRGLLTFTSSSACAPNAPEW